MSVSVRLIRSVGASPGRVPRSCPLPAPPRPRWQPPARLRLPTLAGNNANWDPAAAYVARKQAEGKTRKDVVRCLNGYLPRRVWKLLRDPASSQDAGSNNNINININSISAMIIDIAPMIMRCLTYMRISDMGTGRSRFRAMRSAVLTGGLPIGCCRHTPRATRGRLGLRSANCPL